MHVLFATKRFFRDEEGVTAIEYGLIAAAIAVVVGAAAASMGESVNTIFQKITNTLSAAA